MLKEGDVIKLKVGHKVYANVPRHFIYANCRGDFTKDNHSVTIGGNFDYLAGKYIVYKTAMDGGGTGHGPHDVYPDGHHVYCENVETKERVDFYQSGCFTCMIADIKPIGKAKLKWVVEDNQ